MGRRSDRVVAQLAALRSWVRARPGGRLIWRVIVAITGGVFVVGGLILVPLPGPGWLIVFLGLAVWGTEFAWAERLLFWVRRQVATSTAWIQRRPRWERVAAVVVVVVVVAAVVVGYVVYLG